MALFARTPIGKAYRGALNATEGATLLGHAIEHAVKRAGIDPKAIRIVRRLGICRLNASSKAAPQGCCVARPVA